jgi:pseudaminic acid cytidylyltransferase
MGNVAIIPARGGSKRIPKKNIRLFEGKPIIAYSIEAAKRTALFEKIIVSTDSDEIATVAVKYGAEAPFRRPSSLSDDYTGTGAVVWHAVDWLRNNGTAANYVCCIYATASLIRPEFIVNGYELLRRSSVTSVVSVTTFPSPIFRALKLNDEGRLVMVWPEHLKTRSQDLPETYGDAGQFYWAEAEKFLEERTFFSKDALPIVLPRYLVQDIDTPEDWETAEKMYRFLNGNG